MTKVRIEIRPEPFEPFDETRNHQASLTPGSFGANAMFIGSMRDFNLDDTVNAMHLEHYPGMTEKQLAQLVEESMSRFAIDNVLVLHRVGQLHPGEPIVLVAAWSAHRQAAFDACRQIMEHLKSKATFWKKESLEQGERWVGENT